MADLICDGGKWDSARTDFRPFGYDVRDMYFFRLALRQVAKLSPLPKIRCSDLDDVLHPCSNQRNRFMKGMLAFIRRVKNNQKPVIRAGMKFNISSARAENLPNFS